MPLPSIKDITKERSASEIIIANKDYLFPVFCYIAGLVTASLLYAEVPLLSNAVQRWTVTDYYDFRLLLLHRLAVYMTIFSVTMLMGMCMIGFPFIHIVPLAFGFVTAVRVAYYYTESGVRGLGFVLLMVAPEAATLMTVLIYTIRSSTRLSRQIYRLTTKKTDAPETESFRMHLKNYGIYAASVIVISFVNAGAEYLLGQLIHL